MPITVTRKTPHIVYSAMPYREEWRINGKLSLASQEALVDYFDDTTALFDDDEVCSLVHHYENSLDELKGSLVEEDFLTNIKGMVAELLKTVKGDNKERVQEILDQVEEAETELQQAMEYANEQVTVIAKGIKASKELAEKLDL